MKNGLKVLATASFASLLVFSSFSSSTFAENRKKTPTPVYESYESEPASFPLADSEFDIEEDVNGNIKKIPSVKFIKLKKGDKTVDGQIVAESVDGEYYDSAGYRYVYYDYTQSSASKKLTTFKVSEVSIDNRTASAITLKYTQKSDVTKTWSVDTEISGSTSFGTSFLAKVDASLAIGASKSNTALTSTTVEFTMNVRPGYRGSISKYFPGGYGTGTSRWKKYTSTGTYVGLISKSNDGYAVAKNHDHFSAVETSI